MLIMTCETIQKYLMKKQIISLINSPPGPGSQMSDVHCHMFILSHFPPSQIHRSIYTHIQGLIIFQYELISSYFSMT